MDYSRFNYVAQPGDNAYLLPIIGVYDYFAIDWGYRVIPGAKSCADQWPELDRLAAKQVEDVALRFGGENNAATVDSSVNTQVLGSDPIEATDMGLRNIDRVAPMLIPATTDLGRPYTQLSEVYATLLVKRQKELLSVAKMVGGVEEVRYHAGRGTLPFSPVSAERQRKAVKFLVDRGFTRPDALLDPQLLWRMVPYGGADAVQDTNQKLLAELINKDVFNRMAEAATFPGAVGTYQGADMLFDLNDGIFSELKQARPVIDPYRRNLQRTYVNLLLSSFSSTDGPSEFRVALRSGSGDLKNKLDQAVKKVRDPQTRGHLNELRTAIGG
jgi:hypothetical protein